MSRLEQSLTWGIISFLNRPDFNVLRNTSTAVRHICDKNQSLCLFYGYNLPIYGKTIITYTMGIPRSKKSDVFCHLIYKNYTALEESVKNCDDVFYDYVYTHLNDKGVWVNSMRGATVYNYCWNSMTLMQVAYMLKDGIAIDILHKYARKTAYKLTNFTSEHNMDTITLIEKFNEHAIIPYIYKESVKYKLMVKPAI